MNVFVLKMSPDFKSTKITENFELFCGQRLSHLSICRNAVPSLPHRLNSIELERDALAQCRHRAQI